MSEILSLVNIGWSTAIAGVILIILYFIFRKEIKLIKKMKKNKAEQDMRKNAQDVLNTIKGSGLQSKRLRRELMSRILSKYKDVDKL